MAAPKKRHGDVWKLCQSSIPSGRQMVFRWEIGKDSLINKQVGEYLTSPEFLALDAKWRMKLFLRGLDENNQNKTLLNVQTLNCTRTVQTEIQVLARCYGKSFTEVGYLNETVRNTSSSSWDNSSYYNNELIMHAINSTEFTKLDLEITFIPSANMSILEDPPIPWSFDIALDNPQYSDVKFFVKHKHIFAHKIVLANKSKVFAAMFEHEMKENISNVVNVEDIEYDVLLELFRYIYTGTVNNIGKIVKSLWIAADKYDIIDLKIHCAAYLGKNLTADNVLEYLDFAKRHDNRLLQVNAIDFIKSNANKIIHSPVFELITESHPDIVVAVVRYLFAKKPMESNVRR